MNATNFVIFNKTDRRSLLEQFGFSIKGTGKHATIQDNAGNDVKCPCCDKLLYPRRLGTIAPGSRLLFCDNPTCFAVWIAEKKIA